MDAEQGGDIGPRFPLIGPIQGPPSSNPSPRAPTEAARGNRGYAVSCLANVLRSVFGELDARVELLAERLHVCSDRPPDIMREMVRKFFRKLIDSRKPLQISDFPFIDLRAREHRWKVDELGKGRYGQYETDLTIKIGNDLAFRLADWKADDPWHRRNPFFMSNEVFAYREWPTQGVAHLKRPD